MALIAELNTIAQKDYDKVLTEQCYDRIPFYKKLKEMDRIVDGGTEFAWPIRHKKLGLANAVAPDQQITYRAIPTRTQAEESWKYYVVPQLIPWDVLASAKGKNRIIDIQADKAKEMQQDLDDRLATDLFTANPNGMGITPLSTIVSASATYAGIAVADCAAWAAVVDTTTTKLSVTGGLTTTLTGMRDQATFGLEGPDFYLTTKVLLQNYAAFLEPKYVGVYQAKDKSGAGLGFTSLFFYGDPVIADPGCPALAWYGLCMKTFEFVIDPDYKMKASAWENGRPLGYPNAVYRDVSFRGNLKCTERRVNFAFTALVAE